MESIKLFANTESEKILLKAKSKLTATNDTKVTIQITAYKNTTQILSETKKGSFQIEAKQDTYIRFKANRDILLIYEIKQFL